MFEIKAFAKSKEFEKTSLIIWNERYISLNLQRFSGVFARQTKKTKSNHSIINPKRKNMAKVKSLAELKAMREKLQSNLDFAKRATT